MPSTSHDGVRPEVAPASAAWVSSWATTRRRSSSRARRTRGQTTSSRCETTLVTRCAGPSSWTAVSAIAASALDPADVLGAARWRPRPSARRRRGSGRRSVRARAASRRSARSPSCRARRQAGRVDVEARRDEHDEVAARRVARRRRPPTARRPRRPSVRGDPPAAAGAAQDDRRLGARTCRARPGCPTRRRHVRPRAAPVDVEAVDPQLHVAQAERAGRAARRRAVAGALRARRGRGVGARPRRARSAAARRSSSAWICSRADGARSPPARCAARAVGDGVGRRRRAPPPQPATATASAASATGERPPARLSPGTGAPGSAGASRPASQRSAEAPTSANGPSWRRAAVAGEARQQRRVLARVVGARRGRVAAVVGGDDQQVALRVEAARASPPTARVDRLQRAVEARRRRCGGRRPGRSRRGW